MNKDFTEYAVIIVNYGDPALISKNVGQDLDADEGCLVVVVDNFHSHRTRAQAEELCRQRGWLLIASPNEGFGAGVNRGTGAARALGHRAFITLNPDAAAPAAVLRELARHVLDHPRSLVSPSMATSDGRPHFRGAMVSMRSGQMRSGWALGDRDPEWKNWLSGACLAVGAEAFDLLGGLSEEYFMYWEDVDVSRRAAALGLDLELRSDLVVVHDEGGTQGRRSSPAKSPLYYRYNIRNRMLFGRRFLRGRDWARWVAASPRQSLLIWMRGGRRQALTDPQGVVAALRGFAEGMTYVLRGRPPQAGTAAPPRPGGRASAAPSPVPSAGHVRTPRVTIAIPSYRRPQQLRALLAALPERIAETADARVDVLVVDNDPAGSAEETTIGTDLDLRYAREDTPGIAAVRNRVLDECRGSDLIAFIDDDE
ncbi:MAG TPA: glycosyltransferase, partial [Brevibacterium sp.]|nr:glycosyltransferase [Brevibacterium sp.]